MAELEDTVEELPEEPVKAEEPAAEPVKAEEKAEEPAAEEKPEEAPLQTKPLPRLLPLRRLPPPKRQRSKYMDTPAPRL